MKSVRKILFGVVLLAGLAIADSGCVQIKKPLVDLGGEDNYSTSSGTDTQTGSQSQQVQRLQYLVNKYKNKLDDCEKENDKLKDKVEKLEDKIDDMK